MYEHLLESMYALYLLKTYSYIAYINCFKIAVFCVFLFWNVFILFISSYQQ